MRVRRRSEPGGRFLYILSGALTTYSIEESQKGAEKAPVPPCILPVEDGTSQVSLEVDDRCVNQPVPYTTPNVVSQGHLLVVHCRQCKVLIVVP